MNLYARISLCRTINRSLDYAACLSRVRKYGLGRHVRNHAFDSFDEKIGFFVGFNFTSSHSFINISCQFM